MSRKVKLLIKNLEQVVQVCNKNELFKRGQDQDEVAVIERKIITSESSSVSTTGAYVAVSSDGLICAVGHDNDKVFDEVMSRVDADTSVIDGSGHCVTPGFVDSHTHSVWSGDRLFEFDLKMGKPKAKGQVSYLDIHKSGGGIYFTVNETTKSTEQELVNLLIKRIQDFSSCGTTTVEIKTGYGLDAETEIKQLKVIKAVQDRLKDIIEIVITLLPAHAVPKNMTSEEGTLAVIGMLTTIAEEVERLNIKVDLIDAFCETGVYDVQQCKRIFDCASKLFPNLLIGFHGEELSNLDSPLLARHMHNIRHISHLEHISEDGMECMSTHQVAAVLLPTTAYLLRLKPPNVRRMIDDHSIICSLGSDFNPNAYCYSMATVMMNGVIYYRMTLNEALVAATINSAYAINRSSHVGSIEIGKKGDLVLIKSNDWKRIIYQMGESKDLIAAVVKEGNVIVNKM